jgi:hypothetical protein
MTDRISFALPSYQGPAVLVFPDGREYQVGVVIRPEQHVSYAVDERGHEFTTGVTRSWTAAVDGRVPAPPYGECLVRLPDGSEGLAVFTDMRGSSESRLWEGDLVGRGPSPVVAADPLVVINFGPPYETPDGRVGCPDSAFPPGSQPSSASGWAWRR